MKKNKYSSPYLAKDYFSGDLLPSQLYAGRKVLRQNNIYRQHDELELMLVRSGDAVATINAVSYPLTRGSLLCLSPGYFYKVEIPKGCRLEITECHMNPGIYFYLTACPYYCKDSTDVPTPPVFAQLGEALTVQVTQMLDELAASCEKTPITENQPAFFLLMKLFGILEKHAVSAEECSPMKDT